MRDTILVVGPSASGKTEILNILRRQLQEKSVLFEYTPLSDSHTILSRTLEDDRRGGHGHDHPWCEGNGSGHTHAEGKEELPFTVTGNEIVHSMMRDFFTLLSERPETGRLQFAEWSGGINTNPSADRASRTDLSFKTIGQFLSDGSFPSSGLDRVLAVIHPETDTGTRMTLNTSRHLPTRHEITEGTASWPLAMRAMRIFGEDDFYAVEPILDEHHIPFVISVKNEGSQTLQEKIRGVTDTIVLLWENEQRTSLEGQNRGSRKEV